MTRDDRLGFLHDSMLLSLLPALPASLLLRLRQLAATRPLPITPSDQQEMTSQAAGDSSLPASVPIPDLSDPSLADWREEQVLNLRMSWNSKVSSHTLLRHCSAFLPVGLEGLTCAFGG